MYYVGQDDETLIVPEKPIGITVEEAGNIAIKGGATIFFGSLAVLYIVYKLLGSR